MIYLFDFFYVLIMAFINNKINVPITCRISFLLASVINNSNSFFNKDFVLFDNFPKSDILIDINLFEEYILSIGLLTLGLINDTYLTDKTIINDYIKLNEEYIVKNDIMDNIKLVIIEYLNYRYKDGWNIPYDLNNLYNKDNRIILNENQDFNTFPNKYKWTPVEGQKPMGGTFGEVLPPVNIDENIYTFAQQFFENINLESETIYIFQKSLNLSEKQKCIAQFYEGSVINPPMTWLFYLVFVYRNMKTPAPLNEIINSFFLLTLNLFVTAIVVWKIKYGIGEARPIQLVRMIKDIDINYYYGNSSSSIWKPYLNTPPFPDIISGHSTFSSSSCFVFGHFLGSNLGNNLIIDKKNAILISPLLEKSDLEFINFNNMVIPSGTVLKDNTVLSSDIILDCTTWNEVAFNCSLSRFYGGIHFYSSNQLGLIIGKLIYDMLID